MAAIGSSAAQDLIDEAAQKGYSADDVQELAKRIDGRALEYVSRRSERRITEAIMNWPDRSNTTTNASDHNGTRSASLATPRQVDYMVDLYARITSRDAAELARDNFARLTKAQASVKIDELKHTAG